MNIREEAVKMKQVAPVLAASSNEERNAALRAIGQALQAQKEAIFAANAEDCRAAEEAGIAQAVMKRLVFNEAKLTDVCKGIDQLISLPDPIGRTLLKRELDAGLVLERVSVPIGVIGVIFEARPDALVQISTLCLKSGNCAILKGGKETAQTNRVLFSIIRDAAVSAGLPASCLLQAELHNEIDELLQCEKEVDLLIPRGSNQFVQYIMNNTKIPVMGHADGICHIYVDRDADQEMAVQVILDAKTQYTAACNAVETVLVHRDIAPSFLPKLARALHSASVRLRGTQEAEDLIVGSVEAAAAIDAVDIMTDEDFRTEYLDLILSVKVVADVEEAIDHINRYGSHHTDSIITRDDAAADRFLQMVDSAGVYRNCSTRFADGFRYGFGAEVGISTSKLHARGPVGLEGLVTYKYLLRGEGQIVGDYASGRSSFHFRDLM
jgi:glutamate-5-semialdehyde dehydrogenase